MYILLLLNKRNSWMLLYSMIFVWILAENHMDGENNFFTSCGLIFQCTFFCYWINYLMNALIFHDSAKFCYIKTHFWSYQSLRFYAYWSLFSSWRDCTTNEAKRILTWRRYCMLMLQPTCHWDVLKISAANMEADIEELVMLTKTRSHRKLKRMRRRMDHAKFNGTSSLEEKMLFQ